MLYGIQDNLQSERKINQYQKLSSCR